MPNRYTRKITPNLLDDLDLDHRLNGLYDLILQSAFRLMPESNGWSAQDGSVEDSHITECRYGDFCGQISLTRSVDVRSVRGEGMVREPYVLISLTCQDERKVDAEIAQAEVVQGFEKVFSVIGSAVIGFLGLFTQIAILRVISWEVTVGCFVGGFFLGGLTGYMLGEPISNFLGRNSRVKTQDDQVDLGVARAEWSSFIDSVIEPIAAFAIAAEAVPSKAIVL